MRDICTFQLCYPAVKVPGNMFKKISRKENNIEKFYPPDIYVLFPREDIEKKN